MFTTPVDIGNRALQHVGAPRIATFEDVSKQAAEVGFCYDKLRRAELRRSVWRFATRRAVLRPFVSGDAVAILPPQWASGTAYTYGSIVQDTNGTYWIAMVQHTADGGNAPGTLVRGYPFAYWQQYFGPVIVNLYDATIPYYAGELVYNGAFYVSLANNNTAILTNTGAWTVVTGASAIAVVSLIAAGTGVTINGRERNLFPLPYGYLRATYPDPKVESTSTNVTSAGLRYSDWQLENNWLISHDSTPIIFRFVADVSDVTIMDDLFCEGLSARIAYEICEPITQSNIKLQAIAQAYQKFIADARLVNIIETGSTEPEEDTYQLTQGPSGVAESSVAIAQRSDNGGGRGGQ